MLGISERTLRRWEKELEKEYRGQGSRSKPVNSLREAEKILIIAVATSNRVRDLSLSQIVQILVDSGMYIASEASFYRVLKEKETACSLEHSNNGGPMKGASMLVTLQWLGITPSFSRPSVSDDNAYSEALFKKLKYQPVYPSKPFEDLQPAETGVDEFVSWYNFEHRHSGIRFVTPASKYCGKDKLILGKRKEVYEEAKQRNPMRWVSGKIWNFEPIQEVALNPSKLKKEASSDQKKIA